MYEQLTTFTLPFLDLVEGEKFYSLCVHPHSGNEWDQNSVANKNCSPGLWKAVPLMLGQSSSVCAFVPTGSLGMKHSWWDCSLDNVDWSNQLDSRILVRWNSSEGTQNVLWLPLVVSWFRIKKENCIADAVIIFPLPPFLKTLVPFCHATNKCRTGSQD